MSGRQSVRATRERQLAHERDVAQLALAELRSRVDVVLRALRDANLPSDPPLFMPYFDGRTDLARYIETALDETRGKP